MNKMTTKLTTVLTGPVCRVVAKPRCAAKGHLVHCATHDIYHNPRSECVQCRDQRQRDERDERQKDQQAEGTEGKHKVGSAKKRRSSKLAKRRSSKTGKKAA